MKKILVFGLGRSGIAVARAAISKGIGVEIIDESPLDRLSKPDLVSEVKALGCALTLNWNRELSDLGLVEAVVVNPAVDRRHAALAAILATGVPIFSEVEFAYQISRGPILAITGTNGKSTTTVMTWLALRSAGVDPLLCGNLFGSGYPEQPLTTAALNGDLGQPLVAEVSSFQLEWIQTFRPKVAAITNITPDHSDRYNSFDEYAQTKYKIFDHQTNTDWAVVNGADPITSQLIQRSKIKARILRVGKDAVFNQHALEVFGRSIPYAELPFTEEHNVKNCAMAMMIAACSLEPNDAPTTEIWPQISKGQFEALLDGIRKFKGLSHRMERLGSKGGIEIINNSMCTNPAALVASLKSLGKKGRVLIGGVSKDLDFTEVGNYLRSSCHAPYLYGRDRHLIAQQMNLNPHEFETMEEAFACAAQESKEGDTILLAPGCASQDQFRDFRHRGDVFRELAKDWLAS